MARLRPNLTALLCLCPLLGWWLTGLFDLDEGFYAAVVAEMNRRHEWITPFYNGNPWFEKPILLYWMAKPAVAAFGPIIGPRLPSVVCALTTYGVLAAFLRRHRPESALLGPLILATSLLPALLGRLMMTDAPLMLALSVAFLSFWESLVGDRRWRLLTAAAIGVGVLAKGPVAALLFLPVAMATYVTQPDKRDAFRGQWLAGIGLLLAVVAIWYVPAYLASGQLFVQKFLIEQNIGRFTGGDAAHTLGVASLPLYVPIVLLGMLPWSGWIIPAWPRKSADGLERYLGTWALTIFLFFSLSGAKLPHYVLPLFPPLAMLVAGHLANRKWAWGLGAAMAAILTVALNVGLHGYYTQLSHQDEIHALARFVRQQGGKVSVYQMSRRERDRGTGSLQLRETSLPSLLLYLDATVVEAESPRDLVKHGGPLWILTRRGRIDAETMAECARQGRRLERIAPPLPTTRYEVYRLR